MVCACYVNISEYKRKTLWLPLPPPLGQMFLPPGAYPLTLPTLLREPLKIMNSNS